MIGQWIPRGLWPSSPFHRHRRSCNTILRSTPLWPRSPGTPQASTSLVVGRALWPPSHIPPKGRIATHLQHGSRHATGGGWILGTWELKVWSRKEPPFHRHGNNTYRIHSCLKGTRGVIAPSAPRAGRIFIDLYAPGRGCNAAGMPCLADSPLDLACLRGSDGRGR